MSYATRSEVYFAESGKGTMIKIGETTNANRRSHQLEQQDFHISMVVTLDDENLSYAWTESQRLFIEAGLRLKIASRPDCRKIRTDYFECASNETIKEIRELFFDWVEELESLSIEL